MLNRDLNDAFSEINKLTLENEKLKNKVNQKLKRTIAQQEVKMNSFRLGTGNIITKVEQFYHESLHMLEMFKMNPSLGK